MPAKAFTMFAFEMFMAGKGDAMCAKEDVISAKAIFM